MNEGKIAAIYGESSLETRYLIEVSRRMAKILNCRSLSVDETVALINILGTRTIRLNDGFLINDEADLTRTIGYEMACSVGAAICEDPDQEPEWWKWKRLSREFESDKYEEAHRKILDEIVQHPDVLEIQ